MSNAEALPSRFPSFKFFPSFLSACVIAFGVYSLSAVEFSLSEFVNGFPNMAQILGEMFPPSLARTEPVARAVLVTFQMAFVGMLFGVLISLPLGVLASRTQSPNALTYQLARGVISLFRTVPDLIWALFFVATVGLGPFAGTLTIIVDTIGFCGRFFAEAIEEVDEGPVEAFQAIGAGRLATLFCAVFPACMPSFINSSLFSLEKAVRSSVVLGLVGAGGVGVELKVSMDMFRYSEAASIIIAIFLLVVVVEQISSRIRAKLM